MAFHGFRSRLPRHPARAGKNKDKDASRMVGMEYLSRFALGTRGTTRALHSAPYARNKFFRMKNALAGRSARRRIK